MIAICKETIEDLKNEIAGNSEVKRLICEELQLSENWFYKVLNYKIRISDLTFYRITKILNKHSSFMKPCEMPIVAGLERLNQYNGALLMLIEGNEILPSKKKL